MNTKISSWIIVFFCFYLFFASNALSKVVINEIHYHPSSASVQQGEDPEDLQFLELYNTGPNAENLSGWSFSQGITYKFASGVVLQPQQYLVLAKNTFMLLLRGPAIPNGVPVYQWTNGDLSNSGETIELVDSQSNVVDSVTYDDTGLWPSLADGGGSSLELTNPDYDNSYPQVWKASVGINGTPGAKNSRYTDSPLILFESPERNGIVPALSTISIIFSKPVTGVAPSNLVVDGSSATNVTGSGAGPYMFTGFALPKSNPFTVTISSGAIKDANGNPFNGDSWVYYQSVPPIVINEIHYNPPSSTDAEEFVELFNAGSTPVDISGWKLADFASPGCVFPANTIIQPNSYVVCAKDPSALQAATGYVTNFSWGTGDSLSNGGEAITLYNAVGTIVDRVVYDDDPPWPTGPGSPDGYGPSLELINPNLDNSNGQFWKASNNTHGTPGAKNSIFIDIPIIASENPKRGSVITNLTQISVTFSKPVTGVMASLLTVNDKPATSVSGSGAGPYIFTVQSPPPGTVEVVFEPGNIKDAQGMQFPGDAWLYYSNTPKIVINEIHYHPSKASVGANENPEYLQFVELYNAETFDVNMSGWAMSAGIGIIFPQGTVIKSGSYLVIAENGAFLKSKVTIPPQIPIYNWTSGNLANGGEKLVLQDLYGNVIDQVEYSDGGDWTDAPDGNGPSLELINPMLKNEYGGAWKGSTVNNGTPGMQNSVYQANPAPIIFGTKHSPPIPRGGDSVTITAFVLDEAGAPQSVTLYYRLDQNPPIEYSQTQMYDDGQHGDGQAGDGKYGAILPGLADGQQLDFYIQASDGIANAVAPPGHAILDKYGLPSQTYLCKFSNETLPNDFPVYHILVTLAKKSKQESLSGYPAMKEPFDATFIDDKGNIWYNVEERYRGQSSIGLIPRSYRVNFPSNRPLQSALGFPVKALQLNGNQPVRQYLGFYLFNRANMPAPKTAWARLRYTGINYDTCCTGSNGFRGLYAVVEYYDNDFLDSQGGKVSDRGLTSDGNLYRGRNDADLRWEGTNPNAYRVDANGQNGYKKYNHEDEDYWGDLIATIDALSNSDAANYVDHVKAHIDVDNWAKFFALHMLLGNREGGLYLDTGDDYFIYFYPPNDPLNPKHPNYTTNQMPNDKTTNRAKLMPWDTDSVLRDTNYTIWRSNVTAIRNFLRHNAFAPIFVKYIEDISNYEFSLSAMGQVIDAMPSVLFPTSGGSDTVPETKQQYKNWISNRIAYVLNETIDNLTLNGIPTSPYTNPDPVIALSGTLQQAGTHNITVNGEQANFSVYSGTWSYNYTLKPGMNYIKVEAWDRNGKVKKKVEGKVFYNPPGPWELHMELRAPKRMINTKTLTIDARIVDPITRKAWYIWDEWGKITVKRVPQGTTVPITVTQFDPHLTPPDKSSIHFYNGWGSASFTLDEGANFTPGDIEVTVTWNGLSASKVISVIGNPVTRKVSGTLSGDNLIWGPDEVIEVTGNCTVPSGSTLKIKPGTLIQVNTTGSLCNGTLITINGNLEALGTRDNPIFFFSEKGPQAMYLTQSGSACNPNAWRGFQFYGSGSSILRYVFLTGAGNGNVVSHPRPPILGFFNNHNILVEYCVFADNNGMIFSGQGSGKYTIRRSLISRAGIGGEFFVSGHTLILKDSWFQRVGHAPESENLDGDLLHVDATGTNQYIRSCIFNDGGDDGIDHSNSSFTVEHSMIAHVRDKGVSMTGGHMTGNNLLIFECSSGIRGLASLDHVTVATPSPLQTADVVFRSIFWPSSIPTCNNGKVTYTDVGNKADLGCGAGNISADPLYIDTAHDDYDIKQGSPAWTAGPDGERIGWLGFPYGSTCKTTADCNDTNACTSDVCINKLCYFTPIVGCVPCEVDPDCDDNNPCTNDICNEDGTCSNVNMPDGSACDDGDYCTSGDKCVGGVCKPTGVTNCDDGNPCTDDGCTAQGGCTHVNNTKSCEDGNLCTIGDQCKDGKCVSGTPLVCNDNNPCTDDSCDPASGCKYVNNTGDCDDGNPCTVGDKCQNGKCVSGQGLDCNDNNPCTTDTCDPVTGCKHTNNSDPCDDNNVCTDNDMCVNGVCKGIMISCDDNNPCTDDICDSVKGCLNTPNSASCDDGKDCTSSDVCKDGICLGTENCPQGQTCGIDGKCTSGEITISFQQGVDGYNGTEDTFIAEDAPTTPQGNLTYWRFDLGVTQATTKYGLLKFNSIIGNEPNQIPEGATIVSAKLTLYIEDPSAGPAGLIHEVTIQWSESSATWNNFGGDIGVQEDEYGVFCGSGPLSGGIFSVDVTDSIQMWVMDQSKNQGWIFIPKSSDGVRVSSSEHPKISNRPKLTVTYKVLPSGCTNDNQCDDGKFCNGKEKCNPITKKCEMGVPVNCNDGVACTVDFCNEKTKSCENQPKHGICDDGNVCTDDICEVGLGCRYQNNKADCDDGNECTIWDKCENGICIGGEEADCDDGVACTDDYCKPEVGCVNEDNCEGGLICNKGSGLCIGGPTIVMFQDGQGGYDGTVDTYLDAGAPNADNHSATVLTVDGKPPAEEERQVLIRFENIFGDGLGQIPMGSPIVSATLTIFIANSSASGAELHRMLVPWSDKDTWNSMGSGVQTDGTEALKVIDAYGAEDGSGVYYNIDVTSSLIAWSSGQPNYGWVFVAPDGGTDAWQFVSSEGLIITQRPMLTVSFMPCETGYKGDGKKCWDVNECVEGMAGCDANADCKNIPGSYICSCKDGFEGDGYVCEDKDECALGIAICDKNAICKNIPGSYACECKDGFIGDGKICKDIDECQGDPPPCGDHSVCTNLEGSYKCDCMPGWTGDGKVCNDVNECFMKPYPCDSNATCVNTLGSYICTCIAGYIGDGKQCKDINECAEMESPCDANAICINTEGSYKCLCKDGYIGNGAKCGECPGGSENPCNGNGICVGKAENPVCICKEGFEGEACEDCKEGLWGPECKQQCTGGENNPCNKHGICDDGISGTGKCTCFAGYAGLACEKCADGYFAYPDCTKCPECSDGNICTTDKCDPSSGCVYIFNTNPCDDNNPCTKDDTCELGECRGKPINCDDGNPCTEDICDLVSGCLHIPKQGDCDDENECTINDVCVDGVCSGQKISCDDGNPCTEDTCDPEEGCLQTLVNGDCDDSNACTLGDICILGTCIGEPLTCNDNNPCTDDSCDPVAGCVFVANKAPCDDGNPCTINDICIDGICFSNISIDCNDDNLCTVDICDALSGCKNIPLSGCCEKDEDCTPKGKCLVSKCDITKHECGEIELIPNCCSKDEECDDGKDDTLDTCNPENNTCVNVKLCDEDQDCLDNDPCTSDICNQEKGTCSYAKIDGCCKTDKDCGDAVCIDHKCTQINQEGQASWEGVYLEVYEIISEQSQAEGVAKDGVDQGMAEIANLDVQTVKPGKKGGGGGCALGFGSRFLPILLLAIFGFIMKKNRIDV